MPEERRPTISNKTNLGSLIVVGTGIQIGQITLEAQAQIKAADKVLYLLADPASRYCVKKLNPSTESLHDAYREGPRIECYQEMAERTLSYVRQGMRVCLVLYGHPGVFVNPSHEAVRRARLEGFHARMLPGISAEDCLFADLGIDPANDGCQSFEATDFLLYRRDFDVRSTLILWQVGVIGQADYKPVYGVKGLEVLTSYLCQHYSSSHEVIVYEASPFPTCDPVIQRVPIDQLLQAVISPISTLLVPPQERARPDPQMFERLRDVDMEDQVAMN